MIKKIKFKLKKGDRVKVITGEDKGKEGKILKVIISKSRIIVEGVNIVSKHLKPNSKNPQGEIIKKEASIHISNVMLMEGKNIVRVGYRIENERKVRISKKSNKVI